MSFSSTCILREPAATSMQFLLWKGKRMCSVGNYVINISEDCHDFEPHDLLPRSSTIQRFIESDIYSSKFEKVEIGK